MEAKKNVEVHEKERKKKLNRIAGTFDEKPYEEEHYTAFRFWSLSSIIFHAISFLFVIAGGWMFIDIDILPALSDRASVPIYIIFGIIVLFGIGVSVMIEVGSSAVSKNVFISYYTKGFKGVAIVMFIAFAFLRIFSLGTSTAGGYYMSYYFSDKTVLIDNDYKSRADSLKISSEQEIAAYESAIGEYNEIKRDRKRRSKSWGLDAKQLDDLNANQAAKERVKKELSDSLKELRGDRKTDILGASDNAKTFAWIVFAITALIEVFQIIAYRNIYRYAYFVNEILIDKGIKKPVKNNTSKKIEINNFEEQSRVSAPIGFRPGQNNTVRERSDITFEKPLQCCNCGGQIPTNTRRTKYCSNECKAAFGFDKLAKRKK